jgi:Holliday junction resolvase
MPNNNRRRGDYFERRARAALEHDGWLVLRSAGSFGAADLVALRHGYTPRLISCKVAHHVPRKEVLALTAAAEKAGAWAVVGWPARPGWLGQEVITRHGVDRLPDLHMPARPPPKAKGVSDQLSPPGVQLSLPFD